MKIIHLSIILFVFSASVLSGQDTAAIYFNKDGAVTTNSGQAAYYRKWIKGTNSAEPWKAYDYFMNNKLRMIGTYTLNELNSRQGHFVYFFENGQKKSEGAFKDNKAEGRWKYWYENGAKDGEGIYHADKREDKWIFLHENGTKKSEGEYLYNQRTGVWKFWDQKGQLDLEENYYKGQIAFTRWYHENGSKKAEGNYLNEKKTGEWVYWDYDEKVYLKGNYLNGVQHGEWTRYFENAQSMKVYYENGVVKDKKLGGIARKE